MNFIDKALWIEFQQSNDKKNMCGIVYRQHNDANEFLDYLSESLERFNRHNHNIYLMGDFNIDLLKYCRYVIISHNSSILQVICKGQGCNLR